MGLSFFGEGIYVTYGGCSKNYIMYWGLRIYYNMVIKISVHKHYK